MEQALHDIEEEALRAAATFPEHDQTNTLNDYIAFATAYLGRAADKCRRNEREELDEREMLVKAAGVIVNAISSLERRGWWS